MLPWVAALLLGAGAGAGGALSGGAARAATGPFALFWSRAQTWIVDAGEGVLYRAPRLYAAGPGGVLFEYALTPHSAPAAPPPGASPRPYGWLYRWVSLDRALLGDTGPEGARVRTPLTTHLDPSAAQGDFSDEHQVLQFTGEWVTLSRAVEQRAGGRRRARLSLYTLDLANRQALTALREADMLVRATRDLLPGLIPPCLSPTEWLVRWQLPAQRPTSWLLLTAEGAEGGAEGAAQGAAEGAGGCPLSSGALRLRAAAPEVRAGELSWRAPAGGEGAQGALYDLDGLLLGGVVDALLHPGGELALLLEGPSRAGEERLLVAEPLALYEPDVRRSLSLWRRGGAPALLSLAPDAELQRLDGARWLPPDHPLLQLLPTHFTPLEASPCFERLESRRVARYTRPPTPPLTGHLCRVDARGRAWGGVEDLSARVSAAQTDKTLFVDVWVRDPHRAPGDRVTFWIGDPSAPLELQVRQGEVSGAQALLDVALARWVEGPRAGAPPKRHRYPQPETPEGGYLVTVELPLALTRGRLSVAVQDVDPSSPEARVTLWVAGEPAAALGAPTPALIDVR